MGLATTEITLANARREDLAPVAVKALADTGALHLCIPEHLATKLELDELERRDITRADGSTRKVRYVGPIHLRFVNRSGFGGALVLGEEVLLGAIPMEDLDLVVIPSTQQVVPNPKSPLVPTSIATGIR